MRLLLSAYACQPGRGSEPGIGWNWALQAARFNDVSVITRESNRSTIEEAQAHGVGRELNILYHEPPRWPSRLRKDRRALYLHYLAWQRSAASAVTDLHRDLPFDAGHHVTYGTIRCPSLFAWTEIPFIWGPVGGGEQAPLRLWPSTGLSGSLKMATREGSTLASRFDPGVRRTASLARSILATTQASADALPAAVQEKTRVMPAMGLPAAALAVPPAAAPVGNELRLLFVGRLLHWKGVQLALDALFRAATRGQGSTLTVVGDGPYRPRLASQAVRLGVTDRVTFLGNRPQAEIPSLLRSHHVLIFPSLQDSGGFAVLEAMAAGLPVICLDVGGPALAVTNETGIRVEASTPEQTAAALADAIARIGGDPELWRQMSAAGRARVSEHFTWERLGDRLRDLYAETFPVIRGQP